MNNRGSEFRSNIDDNFESLDIAQSILVDQIVAILDDIETMETVLTASGPTSIGGNGQLTAHPLIAALRQHRLALAKLVTTLGLDDDSPTTQRARAAANARWQKRS